MGERSTRILQTLSADTIIRNPPLKTGAAVRAVTEQIHSKRWVGRGVLTSKWGESFILERKRKSGFNTAIGRVRYN